MVALDGVKHIQVSLNGKSYTDKSDVSVIQNTEQSTALTSMNRKFLIWLTKKTYPNNFTIIEAWPPLIIYNCMPKQFGIEFLMDKAFEVR